MEFADILAEIIALLQHQGRISYGALKRRFTLDDDYLADLKIELIEAQRLAVDENDRILVWVGASGAIPLLPSLSGRVAEPAPLTYTAGRPGCGRLHARPTTKPWRVLSRP